MSFISGGYCVLWSFSYNIVFLKASSSIYILGSIIDYSVESGLQGL